MSHGNRGECLYTGRIYIFLLPCAVCSEVNTKCANTFSYKQKMCRYSYRHISIINFSVRCYKERLRLVYTYFLFILFQNFSTLMKNKQLMFVSLDALTGFLTVVGGSLGKDNGLDEKRKWNEFGRCK